MVWSMIWSNGMVEGIVDSIADHSPSCNRNTFDADGSKRRVDTAIDITVGGRQAGGVPESCQKVARKLPDSNAK